MYLDIYLLIAFHFVADFVFQPRKMALKKGISEKWLFYHAIIYSSPFLYFGVPFWWITGFLHLIVDYITSRIGRLIIKKDKPIEQQYLFVMLVGFDQMIHLLLLVEIYRILKT